MQGHRGSLQGLSVCRSCDARGVEGPCPLQEFDDPWACFFSVSFASDSGSSISVIGSAAAAARFFSSDGGGSSGCFCFSTAFSGAGLEPFVPLASSVAFEGRAKSFEPPYIRPKFLLLFIHQ